MALKLGAKAAAKKPEPKKAAPKRKSKSSGGSSLDGVKTWLFNNIEKMVLGLMGLATLWIIYSGFKSEGLPANNSPDDLDQQLIRASSVMEQTPWGQVESLRYPEPDRFDEQASKDVIPVKIDDYVMSKPFHPILQKKRKLRTDPPLLAPRDLEVHAGVGPIALAEEKDGSSEPGSVIAREGDELRSLPENISRRYSRGSASSSKLEARAFVSVLGIVPMREQWEKFDEAFLGAAEYASDRDQPIYKFVVLERKDLTAGTDWTPLDMTTLATEPKKWAGTETEVVADKYLISGNKNLVMDLPPILGQDMTRFALHTKVEDTQTAELEARELEGEPEQEGVDLLKFSGNEERRSTPVVHETSEGVGSESSITSLNSDTKMFRFFDFTVERGHRYMYRARLVLEDPNNPADKQPPSMDACEVSVLERRQQAASSKLANHLETPWSEESPSVIVPRGETILAGAARAPRSAARNSPVKIEEPTAKVLAVAWDSAQVFEVPVELDVYRGSLLNVKQKVEAVDPRSQVIRPLENYEFSTNSMVLDIAGGDLLEKTKKGEVRAPSLMLIMDANGELTLTTEFEDLETYESSVIPPDDDLTEKRSNNEEEPARGERPNKPSRGKRTRNQEEQ